MPAEPTGQAMLPLGLVLVLSTFSDQVIGSLRYVNAGDRVELACLYTKGDMSIGDMIQWEKDVGGSAEREKITSFQHVENAWRDLYVATLNTSVGVSLTLGIRVLSINQSGTYRCQLMKNDQEIELARVQLIVFGGDVLHIELPESAAAGIQVMTVNPSPINFTVVAYNDVKEYITVRAGDKDLTSGTSCKASADSGDSKIVNTSCSTDTSPINQGDDGVLLTISVTLPTYLKEHFIKMPLFVLVPPTIECQKTFLAIKGSPTTLTCRLRSRGGQFALAWQRNQKTLLSLESTPSEEQTEGLVAQVNRQGLDRGDGAIATLLIHAVEESSYGVYTLVATNEGGSASADVELKAAEVEAEKPNVAKDVSASGGASVMCGGTVETFLLASLIAATTVTLAANAGMSC